MLNNDLPDVFHGAVKQSRVMNMGYVAEATRRYQALSAEQQHVVDVNVEALMAADDLSSALSLLAKQCDLFPAGVARTSGDAPARRAMLYIGSCVVHARIAQEAATIAAANDVEGAARLIALVRTTPVGTDRERALFMEELQMAFGRTLYITAASSS